MAKGKYPAIGLDLGTNAIVKAVMLDSGEVQTSWVRDAFLELEPANKIVKSTMRKGFDAAGVTYLEMDDKFIIFGDDSLKKSCELGRITQRPMQKGVISPREAKALPMFKTLISSLLGKSPFPDYPVTFSIPASPVDEPFDSEYHCNVIRNILEDLGYKGTPLNEALSIIFSEAEKDDYSAVACSFGSGMCNICIANAGSPVSTFATSKGGDYIDLKTAISQGYMPGEDNRNFVTPSTVQLVKETCGLDLKKPSRDDKIELGLQTYYISLINYTVESIIYQINKLENPPRFLEPVPVIVSGGTSKPKGFVDLFEESIRSKESKLPFKIKEVRHATEPLDAVAIGCLLSGLSNLE